MYIKKNHVLEENEFAGFELDTSAIELHSSSKKNIRLPYLGKLPDAVRVNDGAYISVNITVHLNIRICMVIKLGNKERRYPVEATAKEIDDLLFAFFFVDKKDNSYPTRLDSGLAHY